MSREVRKLSDGRPARERAKNLIRGFARFGKSGSLSNATMSDESPGTNPRNVYTEYADPQRSEWVTKIQPALKKAKLEALVEACEKRLCRREIIELRAGRKKPHRKNQELLQSILKGFGFL
jgi:hypothetical protein